MNGTININGLKDTCSVEDVAQKAMNENHGIGFEKVALPNSTNIKIIIVGAGFAGLACGIECKRKGHDVVILEKFSELKTLGE